MNILFICGSIEPGRDGVGDYTRRLCGELLRTGHGNRILAVSDNYLTSFTNENQSVGERNILVHRIPVLSSSKQRIFWSQDILNEFQPDCISLQFVPYSFNSRGLPFWLPSFLKKLKGNHSWHIMFHELWIGMDSNATFRSKCIGLLQKALVLRILKGKERLLINTQTDLYQSKISDLGYNSQILPLFSNINKNRETNRKPTSNDLELKFCLFGTIHYGAPVKNFIENLKQSLSVHKEIKTIKFIFIGNCGAAIEEWKKVLVANKINFEITGFTTDFEISNLLSSCQYGISTTPFILNQKSGSLAAMFDHQLPVLCVARNWEVKEFNQERISNLINYKNKESLNNFLDKMYIVSKDNNLECVGKKFINGLK